MRFKAIKYRPRSFKGTDFMEATYKSVEMHLWIRLREVTIAACFSGNPGKNEVQEMIVKLREDFPGYKFRGSIPVHPAMEHIFQKFGITY